MLRRLLPRNPYERVIFGAAVVAGAGLAAYTIVDGSPVTKGPENAHVLTADTRLRDLASLIIQREAPGTAPAVTWLKGGSFVVLSEHSSGRAANSAPGGPSSISSIGVEFFPANRLTTGVEYPAVTAIFDHKDSQWSASWTEKDQGGHITRQVGADATGGTANTFNAMLDNAAALAAAQTGQAAPALESVPVTPAPAVTPFGPPSRQA